MIVVAMPGGLTAENRDELRLPGMVRAVARDVDSYGYYWELEGDATTVTLDFVARQVVIPDETSPAQQAALATALAAFGQPPAWDAAARQVLQLAQSAVGVDIRQLTDAQRWALLAVVLFDKKAIAADLKIRPLRDWVIRKPNE